MLPPQPSSVAVARRFADDTLGRHGLNGVVDRVLLLVSELVTNAVLHARTDTELVVRYDGSRVRIEVRDGSPAPPVIREVDPDAMTGRGLALVASLATEWGVDSGSGGKVVWFEVDVPAPARSAGAELG